MESMNIGEIARELGLRTSAIRFYESEGLLPRPPRRSGWRRYDPEILNRIRVIQSARQMGFSLADIKELLNGFADEIPPADRWQAIASQKLTELDAAIQRAEALKSLIQAGLDCRCEDITECISTQGEACRADSAAAAG